MICLREIKDVQKARARGAEPARDADNAGKTRELFRVKDKAEALAGEKEPAREAARKPATAREKAPGPAAGTAEPVAYGSKTAETADSINECLKGGDQYAGI